MSKALRAAQKEERAAIREQRAANKIINCYGPIEATGKKRRNKTKKVNRLDKKKQKAERRLEICGGLLPPVEAEVAVCYLNINRANDRKTNLEQALTKAQSGGNSTKIANLTRKLDKINTTIQKNTGFVSNLERKSSSLTSVIENLNDELFRVDISKASVGQEASVLYAKENILVFKTLKLQDKLDRNYEKKEAARTVIEKLDKQKEGCICSTVYDPVVINGVTYGNSCLATCAGVSVPPEAPKPPKPPIAGQPRKCLQVITCGSDGITYPDSCLPPGVNPVANGKPCEEVNYEFTQWGQYAKRPPANIVPMLKLNVPISALICGTNNISYSNINHMPQGVTIKHFGSCGGIQV
jgi:hypothetical protein